tara:strand:+ start:124 stop:306 length:183 start_codon:yes stop_codon:yes gene_type:complete
MKRKIRNCSTCLRDRPTHFMSYDWGEWRCKTIYESETDEEKENAIKCHKIDEENFIEYGA